MALTLMFTAWVAPGASAQTLPVGDPIEDYLRILQISGMADLGSFTVRPLPPRDFREHLNSSAHPWRDRLEMPVAGKLGAVRTIVDDPRLRMFVNSHFPTGQNDGVVWQGRGVTTALDAGVTATWMGLTVAIRPTLLYTHNSSFELAPVSGNEYAYPWRTIDLPQRFGPDALWTLDPGQSEIRLDTHGVSMGFGTTNLWWGPGIRNAIIMSNNAAGFPHAFLGTGGPVGIGIGEIEARWIWGELEQSDWFDPSVVNRERFITGLVATYAPSFLRGLSLGLTRVFYVLVPDGGVSLSDYFAVFQGLRKQTLATPQNPAGEDEHDQLLSLFGRWVLPESGFEVYWEWARNDHSWDVRDFLLEPDQSQAFTMGLQKAMTLSANRLLTLRAELTHLERSSTFYIRGGGTYYEHHIVTQGYTQKGQVIGAGIGPGGDAQHLGADLFAPWGRASVYVQRDVHDNDAYYDLALATGLEACCHNVSFHLGTQALLFVGDFDLGAGMIITREYNRYFFGLDYWNLNLSFSARWHPN
jgi:hypothetical protein